MGKTLLHSNLFPPRVREAHTKQADFFPKLTDGIVSQQDQFFLQSESPDVEAVACLRSALHPHQNVPKVTRGVSVSVHRHSVRAHHICQGTG